MLRRPALPLALSALAPLLLGGCATAADYASTARRKASLDWGCDRPDVKVEIVSETDEGSLVHARGCGKDQTYLVVCRKEVGEATCSAEPAQASAR